MPNPYREIFMSPGTRGFAAAGFVARLPVAMAPIGIVAMLSQAYGEYWLAGAVSATFALTNATLPYQLMLANKGVERALAENKALYLGLNTQGGKVVHPAVIEAHQEPALA